MSLLPQHESVLKTRAVHPDVAKERGYFSVEDPNTLSQYQFSAEQQKLVPCLLIPRYGVDAKQISAQIRPDNPRPNDQGKLAKYECPAGHPMRLDVHPSTKPVLSDPTTPLVICESTLKADSVLSAGMHAIGMVGVWGWWGTGPAGGRLAVPCFESIALADRTVYIAADSDVRDNPMVALAYSRLHRYLDRREANVHLVAPDPLPDGPKVGVDDFLAAGGDLEKLLKSKSQYEGAQMLVCQRFGDIEREIAYEEFEFFNTSEGIMAAERHGKNVAFPAGKGEFTNRWAAKIYQKTDTIPGKLDNVLQVISGEAADGALFELPLRIGTHDGDVLVDLGRADGQVVRVGNSGWVVEARSPVPFRRSPKTSELPIPEKSATEGLDVFKSLMNISAEDWHVVLGVMIATFFPRIDHPVLAFLGPQGSGKTGVMEAISSLTDPVVDADGDAFGATSLPDVKDWPVSASSSWCLPFDNVSYLTPEMSDMLCRAVTGDGITRRKLYTDNDLVYLRFRRCIFMTGITVEGIRPDLAERMVKVECPYIDASSRVPDSEIGRMLSEARPAAFAQLLDLVVEVRAKLSQLPVEKGLPRLADFGRILQALDLIMGSSTSFQRMEELCQASLADSLVDDPVTAAIVALVGDGEWQGTADELLRRIRPTNNFGDVIKEKGWPESPKSMGRWLARNEVALRQLGIEHRLAPRQADRRDHILSKVQVQVESDVSAAVVTFSSPVLSLWPTTSEVAS
jgi:hypothetical protein